MSVQVAQLGLYQLHIWFVTETKDVNASLQLSRLPSQNLQK